MSVKKHTFRYTAEDQMGNVCTGKVRAKTFKKAFKISELFLEQYHMFKVASEIKLECLD